MTRKAFGQAFKKNAQKPRKNSKNNQHEAH